jgi:bifunctional non-homologous end joining protein LigD
MGLRDDVEPSRVRREPQTPSQRSAARVRSSAGPRHTRSAQPKPTSPSQAKATARSPKPKSSSPRKPQQSAGLQPLIDQLQDLETRRAGGVLLLPGDERLEVSNLHKVFWPEGNVTKGDLMRYYAQVSPFLLPVVADRALVMKRYPNGVAGKAFYQQRAPDPVPHGVRVEVVEGDEGVPSRLVGGSLKTLLYMTQLAAISQDPWFSRVQTPGDADHVAIDLDPTDHATFASVLDVARWVRDELEKLGIPGVPKTSGSSGLHIYIPLAPHTSYESGLLLCQIVATLVATRHPKVATVERTVSRRPRGTVYVDYLQNIQGKTLATAYSARASEFAGVSTPLTWKEIDGAIDPREFTIRTAPARFKQVGDVWEGLRTTPPADLQAVLEKFSRRS